MILRDPVHGLVAFESDEERVIELLLATPEVQRLRRIRQLGVTSLAFPGAEHSRFAHSLGTAFVMKLLIARLRAIDETLPYWHRVTSECARDALAAALLHDVGHGPLSHSIEDALADSPPHEAWTERMLLDDSTGIHRVLCALDPEMPRRVAALVRGQHPIPYLSKAVSGELDVDRCDYLLRDAHATGVGYGHYDLDWLLRSFRFSETNGEPTLAIDGAKGLPAVEAFILARLFMFQQVYLHKATRAAEWMIRAIFARAAKLIADGASLSPLPRAIAQSALGEPIALGDYLELDDNVLWTMLHGWEQAKDQSLADLCRRLRHRELFKTIELFGEQASKKGRLQALAVAQDLAKAAGLDPETHVGLDVAGDIPFGGEPFMVVYAKGPPRPLATVSFLLGRLAGQELTRVRLIVAKELREKIPLSF